MTTSTTRSFGNLPAAAHALEKSISIPLGMFALLFLFLFLQNRIDRHDPKIRVTEASSTDTLPFHLPRTVRHVPLRTTPVRTVPVRRAAVVGAPAPTSLWLPA